MPKTLFTKLGYTFYKYVLNNKSKSAIHHFTRQNCFGIKNDRCAVFTYFAEIHQFELIVGNSQYHRMIPFNWFGNKVKTKCRSYFSSICPGVINIHI